MIFNTSNFLLLIIVCVICYTFWAPYIRGKKTKAVVDGYVHPKELARIVILSGVIV